MLVVVHVGSQDRQAQLRCHGNVAGMRPRGPGRPVDKQRFTLVWTGLGEMGEFL